VKSDRVENYCTCSRGVGSSLNLFFINAELRSPVELAACTLILLLRPELPAGAWREFEDRADGGIGGYAPG
jgi:hypothetical protein